MTGRGDTGRKYGDADGYDNYMGSWSALLSPLFVDFAGLRGAPSEIVDLGCGTGNLLVELARRHPAASLIGIDPSPTLLQKARQRPELARATLREGSVERIPLDDRAVDATLSLLVLQEFSDRDGALAEMVRITRPGGTVAACQWDFARMPVIDALVKAIRAVDPKGGERVSASTPMAFVDESELVRHWTHAGLTDVRAARLVVTRTFDSFDHLWLPLIAGSTPSTLALASLSDDLRDVARSRMREHFQRHEPNGSVKVTAEALVVAGRAPA